MGNTAQYVSIIVPVDNVDLYLSQCLNSLIIQTLSNIEIIHVNYGSTDNSGRICDELPSILLTFAGLSNKSVDSKKKTPNGTAKP